MAGCDCSMTSERRFTRIDPGPPLRVISVGGVRIESECVEVEIPQQQDGETPPPSPHEPPREASSLPPVDPSLVEATVARMRGFKLAIDKGRKAAPQKVCLNTIKVELLAGTTAGWKISEVQTGLDTFAADIGVGNTEAFSTPCSHCEEGVASVKIVDAQGNLQATLGGFAICKPVP